MQAPRALPHAYAHRDCAFKPPLMQSLAAGFSFIEADVYVLLGRVFVAHDPQELRPWRTLEKLYLEPLHAHLKANQGRVFEGDTSLWLFLDVKTAARPSYAAIHALLSRHQSMITSFNGSDTWIKPVTIILSGNRVPYDLVRSFRLRHAALDGRVPDLGVHTHPSVMPIVSDDWRRYFRWLGKGEMPQAEEARLREMVRTAHANGQKLRFWNTPDEDTLERRAIWDKLLACGVDLINTDDRTGLRRYLAARGASV